MTVRRLHPEQPADFALTPENLEWANAQIAKYPEGRQASAVIPILWRAQEQHDGWLPEPAIRCVADLLGMPYIRVLEVATFYTMFQLSPVGKKAHVQVCGTTPCMLRGSDGLIAVCKKKIAAHAHDLSQDGNFSWEEVECLGACSNAPMVQIWKDTYEDLTPEDFEKLLDDIAAGKDVVPGPANGRRFAAPLEGATTLGEIKDDTKGADPLPHVVNGAEAASRVFAGASINGGPGGAPMNGGVGSRPAKAVSSGKAEPVSKPAAKAASAKTPSKAAAKAAAETEEGQPELLKAPRGGKADDLKKIKGLGSKIEGMLNDLGVFHFDQIASWGDVEKNWIDGKLTFRGRIERENWVEQAKALAAGEETEFSKRVEAGDVPTSKG
ncbi:NADH dehydrogenase subunit E [Breoghania corrubedonensis]|uniref:NADH dehydrogenase subunit E n=1 Tax=Breoghania corrubedonensis TaxID=665038 RepID=A0A2T5VBI1_9HYPH|nr:NADH-quinone oxidoreductase subunit NuoE [Breoghania corrubedonensis]PTW61114.1 NADH dehydrogenase subunit E [Breoghania corrubedonensis]